MPLYVNSAICLVPFRCAKTSDDTTFELQTNISGWQKLLCLFFHLILISRAVCVGSLCLDKNFHWIYHECLTADAAAFSTLLLICTSFVVGIIMMHYFGAEICVFYNAIRTVSNSLSGKANEPEILLLLTLLLIHRIWRWCAVSFDVY